MVGAVTSPDARAGGPAFAPPPKPPDGNAAQRVVDLIGFSMPVIAGTLVGLVAFAALALNIGRVQDALCSNAGFCTAQQVLFRKTQECATRAPSCGVDSCLADFRNKATLSRLIERLNEIETRANAACHTEETTSYERAKACADQRKSANICDVAVCFTGYLSSYPGGEYIREARARIASARQACPSSAAPGVPTRPAPTLPGSQAQVPPGSRPPPTLPGPQAQAPPGSRPPPALPGPQAQAPPGSRPPPSLPGPAPIQPAPHAPPSLPPPAQAQPVPHAPPSLPAQLQPAPGAPPRSDGSTLPDGTYNAVRTFVEAKSISDPASCPPSTPVRVTVTGAVIQFENFESNTGITRKWKGGLKPNGEITFQGSEATPPTATEVTINGNYESAEVTSRFCGKGFFKITR